MTIDDKLLEKLENLSAIKIDDDKKESIKSELNDILNFVENLNKMDMQEKQNIKEYDAPIKEGASNVFCNSNIQKFDTPLREDEVILSSISDLVIENAPKVDERFFIVPKIVE